MMSEIVKKRKERLHYPPDLKAVYESSGLGCTYEEWLEDAVRELNLSAKTRWDAIERLEQDRDEWRTSQQAYKNEAEELRKQLASLREYGTAYQHEETGQEGVVDQWQVEQGFFDNNPRLQAIGTVYIREAQEG